MITLSWAGSVLSILFGLIAIGLPMVAAVKRKPRPALFAAGFAFCTLALFLQVMEYHYRVAMGDFSTLMDTSLLIWWASILLVAVVLFFNLLGALICRIKR